MRKTLAFLLLMGLAGTASAGRGSVPPSLRYSDSFVAQAAYTLDAASQSFVLDNPGYSMLVLYLDLLDANDTCTAITMTCTGSHNGGTTDYTLQDGTVASGVFTSVNASWVHDASGLTSSDNKYWAWRVDAEGFPRVECTITDTGGAVADTLTIHANWWN